MYHYPVRYYVLGWLLSSLRRLSLWLHLQPSPFNHAAGPVEGFPSPFEFQRGACQVTHDHGRTRLPLLAFTALFCLHAVLSLPLPLAGSLSLSLSLYSLSIFLSLVPLSLAFVSLVLLLSPFPSLFSSLCLSLVLFSLSLSLPLSPSPYPPLSPLCVSLSEIVSRGNEKHRTPSVLGTDLLLGCPTGLS